MRSTRTLSLCLVIALALTVANCQTDNQGLVDVLNKLDTIKAAILSQASDITPEKLDQIKIDETSFMDHLGSLGAAFNSPDGSENALVTKLMKMKDEVAAHPDDFNISELLQLQQDTQKIKTDLQAAEQSHQSGGFLAQPTPATGNDTTDGSTGLLSQLVSMKQSLEANGGSMSPQELQTLVGDMKKIQGDLTNTESSHSSEIPRETTVHEEPLDDKMFGDSLDTPQFTSSSNDSTYNADGVEDSALNDDLSSTLNDDTGYNDSSSDSTIADDSVYADSTSYMDDSAFTDDNSGYTGDSTGFAGGDAEFNDDFADNTTYSDDYGDTETFVDNYGDTVTYTDDYADTETYTSDYGEASSFANDFNDTSDTLFDQPLDSQSETDDPLAIENARYGIPDGSED